MTILKQPPIYLTLIGFFVFCFFLSYLLNQTIKENTPAATTKNISVGFPSVVDVATTTKRKKWNITIKKVFWIYNHEVRGFDVCVFLQEPTLLSEAKCETVDIYRVTDENLTNVAKKLIREQEMKEAEDEARRAKEIELKKCLDAQEKRVNDAVNGIFNEDAFRVNPVCI